MHNSGKGKFLHAIKQTEEIRPSYIQYTQSTAYI